MAQGLPWPRTWNEGVVLSTPHPTSPPSRYLVPPGIRIWKKVLVWNPPVPGLNPGFAS